MVRIRTDRPSSTPNPVEVQGEAEKQETLPSSSSSIQTMAGHARVLTPRLWTPIRPALEAEPTEEHTDQGFYTTVEEEHDAAVEPSSPPQSSWSRLAGGLTPRPSAAVRSFRAATSSSEAYWSIPPPGPPPLGAPSSDPSSDPQWISELRAAGRPASEEQALQQSGKEDLRQRSM